MFTGIIDHCGMISHIDATDYGLRLKITHSFNQLELGESIAIDGICLTVAESFANYFVCDISPETLNVTTAKNFKVDQLINLERALLPTSRMGGHFVMGHIDQIANIKNIAKFNDFTEMTIDGLVKSARKCIVKKGSIAINGVSLTINDVNADCFSIMLIPHTQKRTNLINLQQNDSVNLELDMLARMVVNHTSNINE